MKFKNEEGYVLVLGIIIIAVLIILVFTMTNIIGMDLSFYRSNRDNNRAFYAAEAGIAYGYETILLSIEEGLFNIEEGEVFPENPIEFNSNVELNGAEVSSIDWELNGNRLILNSVGKSNNIENEIESVYLLSFRHNSILDNVITSGGLLETKNNHVLVDSEDPDVGGVQAADYDGSIKDSDGNDIEIGDINKEDIPTFDADYLESLADNILGSKESPGSYEYEDLPANFAEEFTYVHGDLNIKSNKEINGSGVLVVDGTLNLGTNIDFNQDEPAGVNNYFIIIVLSDDEEAITMDGDNKIQMKGLIYSSQNTDIGNMFGLTGAIISGGDLELINSAAGGQFQDNIIYDPGFIDVFQSWNLMFEDDLTKVENIQGISNIVSWKEK